jgi:hypothetical protein
LLRLSIISVVLLHVAIAQADDEDAPTFDPMKITLGGYMQPQFRLRDDDPEQPDIHNGFRFARVRLISNGSTKAGNLDLSESLEAELLQFTLLDAYVTVRRTIDDGYLVVDGGQMRTPISRQQMLSDSRLAYVDKALLATIAPDRDLGLRVTFAPPAAKYVRVLGGVFNGEGKNKIENLNDKYLYALRLEVSPIGRDVPLAESDLSGDYVTAAFSYGHNAVANGMTGANEEAIQYVGFDVSGGYEGLSGSVEYLYVKHAFTGPDPAMVPAGFRNKGWVVQANYLLPWRLPPYRQSQVELGARIEQLDRGDLDQSVREITAVASFYLRNHTIKAQLAANHTDAFDQLLLQVTYRLE